MVNTKLLVQNALITLTRINDSDFISLTDIARIKNPDEPKDVVKNWMRSRTTIEYIGLWEKINNPDFKGVEFDALKTEAGLNSFTLSPNKWKELTGAIGIRADVLNMALFGHTAKQWRELNPDKAGNVRDYSAVEQLVVLSNLESLNAELIRQGVDQPSRLSILNSTAIAQMQSLLTNPTIKKLR
jgi:hypothetical protein